MKLECSGPAGALIMSRPRMSRPSRSPICCCSARPIATSTSIARARVQASDSLLDQWGSHTIKAGADFNRLTDDSTWDLFFPARIIFPNLSALLSFGPASNSPRNGPVVFWWPFPDRRHVPAALQHLLGRIRYCRLAKRHPLPFPLQRVWILWSGPVASHVTDFSNLRTTLGFRDLSFTLSDSDRPRERPAPRRPGLRAQSGNCGTRRVRSLFADRLAGSTGQVFNVAQDISRGDLPGASALFPGIAPVPGAFYQGTITPGQGPGAPSAAALNLLETGTVPQPGCLSAAPPTCVANLSVNKDGAEQNPYAYHATLQVSHQASKNITMSAAYLFVRAPNLLAISPNLNAPLSGNVEPDGTPIYSPRLSYPALGDFFVSENGGFSNYNGGTAEIEGRMGGNFGLHGSYTYSKTISNVDSLSNLSDFPQTSFSLLRETALAPGPEAPLRLGLPEHRSRAGARAEGHGARRTGYRFQSGAPYTIYAGDDLNQDGNPLSDRPGYPAGSPGCPAGCPLGRNSYIGPWFADLDLRLGRNFKLKERLKLEVTADAFNAFNRTNIKDLNTTCGSGDVLACPNAVPQLTPAGFTLPTLLFSPRDVFNAREIQFAAKLEILSECACWTSERAREPWLIWRVKLWGRPGDREAMSVEAKQNAR